MDPNITQTTLGPLFAPIYTTIDNVKVRLANKVQFQSNSVTVLDGELPDSLLTQLIVDSETEVEQDLRGRYAIPFRSIRTGQWVDLPDHSQRALRTSIDMRCVINILDTDFGRGTHVNAEGYKENLTKHYEVYIKKLLGRDFEADNDKRDRFRFSPPLDDLMLAYTNRKADDGYKGMLINTDQNHHGAEDYAKHQINNPSKSYLNRIITGEGLWF